MRYWKNHPGYQHLPSTWRREAGSYTYTMLYDINFDACILRVRNEKTVEDVHVMLEANPSRQELAREVRRARRKLRE